MKGIITMNNINERKYEITISKADAPNSKYTHKTGYGLMIHGPIGSRESSREFIFLTKDELVCLAKAVKTMNSERICFSDKVRRKYLSGIACDGISTARTFSDDKGRFSIKVEVKDDKIRTGVIYGKIYRVTFAYTNAFGEQDEVRYVLRERDFIALGTEACAALEADMK